MTKLKRILLSAVMAISMLLFTCNISFAASAQDTNIENEDSVVFSATSDSDFFKVNGTATYKGGRDTYTSTITKDCSTLKAMGNLLGGNTGGKYMVITVYKDGSNAPIAWGNIPLDGKFHTLTTLNGFKYYPKGTYTVIVEPSFTGGYEVSTYFYL